MFDWKTCRVCLSCQEDEEEMQFIFKEKSNEENLASKIERCGGVQIPRATDYAKMICAQCFINLTVAHKFWKRVQESHEKLKEVEQQILDNPLSMKPEDEDIPLEMTEEADEVMGDYEMLTGEEGHYMIYEKNPDDEGQDINEIEKLSDADIKVKILAFPNDDDNEGQEFLVMDTKTKPVKKEIKSPKRKGCTSDVHICEMCGNSFKSKSILNLHMRRHQNIRPFKCEICNKNFACHSEIARHIRVHTGAKPFSCQYCDRKFSDRSTNIKHERTHTNERPFVCDQCGRAFMYSNVLKNHKLTHSGEKSFQCVPCNKTFARQHQLQQHTGTLIHKQTLEKLGLIKNE